MSKLKPTLITVGVIVGFLIVYKMVKPYLPTAITGFLPI